MPGLGCLLRTTGGALETWQRQTPGSYKLDTAFLHVWLVWSPSAETNISWAYLAVKQICLLRLSLVPPGHCIAPGSHSNQAPAEISSLGGKIINEKKQNHPCTWLHPKKMFTRVIHNNVLKTKQALSNSSQNHIHNSNQNRKHRIFSSLRLTLWW